jgi:hypothetical protein
VEALTIAAEAGGELKTALAGIIREAARLIELEAKIEGTIASAPQIAINTQFQTLIAPVGAAIMRVLADHPDLRLRMADELSRLQIEAEPA